MELTTKAPTGITTRTLGPFLAISFGLTWGLAAAFMLFSEQLVPIFGEIGYTNPLFILAVYAPGFAGVGLVWWHYGFRGVVSYFRRLTLWRASVGWWLFLILGIPLLFYAGAAVKGTITDPFPFSPWYEVFPALALALFIGPIEEFGWRGLALPLLQRKYAPFWAGLILGVIWALWHVPSFLLGGTPQSAWDFAPFFFGVVAIALILTPMFNAARGSLLFAYLFHFQMNNPIWPDAQPWDTLFFIGAAVILVYLNRRTMFKPGSGVTDVFFQDDQGTEV